MIKTSKTARRTTGLSVARVTVIVASLMLAGCASSDKCATSRVCDKKKGNACMINNGKSVQMDNAKFYKDGKFDTVAAKAAYFEMMENVGAPIYARYKTDPDFFWVVDFAQGDFTSLGMGGLFWINHQEKEYCGHEIFLLPGQSIAEHRHLPSVKDGKNYQAKHEGWVVRYGSIYNFSEIGEPNLDQFPEVKAMLSKKQLPHLVSKHVERIEADGSVHLLCKDESWHFMMGGPNGAVVSEFSTFHDNAGLRFSVPGVAF